MKYFTLDELIQSDTAKKKGIDNTPNEIQKQNLILLIDNILDPLREAYGKPIKVNSGFRCEALNKAVGGASTSEHRNGMASDIVGTPNTKEENKKIFNLVQELRLPFTQMIWEKGNSIGPDWVHISYNKNDVKKQVLHL